MANHLGTKLSRLVRERAYLAGNLAAHEARQAALKKELKKANAEIRQAKARLIELDQEITTLSAIKPLEIKPIRSTPRIMTGKHGEFRRELIRVMREAGGPVDTTSLLKHMAAAFNLPVTTPKERVRATYLIRRPLNVFAKKGAVRRLPSVEGSIAGVWMWIGD